jgi:hypothetical protein
MRPESIPQGRGRMVIWALIGWTIFLWVSRLRNVLTNDDLTSTGRAVRIGVVVVFVVLAAWALTGLRRGRVLAIQVLIGWTIVYWLVRHTGILIDDYSVGFKLIHTVLAIISIGLAASSARILK